MPTPYALSSDLVSAWPAKSLEVATYLDTALASKTDLAMTQNAQTGTTYSFALADASKLLTTSNASPVSVTVTKQATVTWVTGTQLRIMNLGAGVTTLVADTGVTINGNVALNQYQGGTLIRTASDVWTFQPNGAGGKILQVVSVLKADVFTTSSTTLVDVTGLTVTITPSSASSKILVIASVAFNDAAGSNASRAAILRGASVVGGGTAVGNRPSVNFFHRLSANAGDNISPKSFSFIDAPATTSATTYKIQVAGEGNTVAVGYAFGQDNDLAVGGRIASSIVLMEVAA